VLESKATLFFVALFSAVITRQTPMSLRLGLHLDVVHDRNVFSFVAAQLGHERCARACALTPWIDRVNGAILLALGFGCWSRSSSVSARLRAHHLQLDIRMRSSGETDLAVVIGIDLIGTWP